MRLTRFPSWAKSVTAVTVTAAAAQLLSAQGARSRSTWHAERAMFGGPGSWRSKMNTNTESDKSYPNSCPYPVYHPTQMFHIPGHTCLETRWGLHEGSCAWLNLAARCTFYSVLGLVFSFFLFFSPAVDSLLKLSGAFLSTGANISGMTVLSLWVHAQGMKTSSSHDKERDESVFLENIYLSLALS